MAILIVYLIGCVAAMIVSYNHLIKFNDYLNKKYPSVAKHPVELEDSDWVVVGFTTVLSWIGVIVVLLVSLTDRD